MIGQRITAIRTKRGWNQSELARRANLNRAYISQLEAGRRIPGAVILLKVADALDVTVDELVRDAAPSPTPVEAVA
jgi:transcriptional regulator with XRE-family HTH domain